MHVLSNILETFARERKEVVLMGNINCDLLKLPRSYLANKLLTITRDYSLCT